MIFMGGGGFSLKRFSISKWRQSVNVWGEVLCIQK